jgi:hypothetical protein
MEALPHRLAIALQRHNRRSSESVHVQLRLAVHVGPVNTDPVGVSGSAIIHTARILDADVFKHRLAGSAASLGIITSSFVFDNIVRHSVEALRVGEYEEVRCQVKESAIVAWISLTGHPLPR